MNKIVISIILTGLVLSSCKEKKEEKTNTSESSTSKSSITVKVMNLEKQNIATVLDYSANLVADEQLYYAPAMAGRVDKIYVEVGDRVHKGKLLVTMDQSQFKQANYELVNLKKEYDRAVKLNTTGSISKQAYDAAITQYEIAKTNLNYLKENAKLLAPFNGIITGKYFEDGEVYSGGISGGAAKPSIIALERIDPMKAFVNISEQYYSSIVAGSDVKIKTKIYPDTVFIGKVKLVYPSIDEASRTFKVELEIPNKEGLLRTGMYGNVDLYVGRAETIIVPAIAVLKLQGSNERYVFINDNGKAKRISVKVGRRFEDQLEIISDEIMEGTELIVVGQSKLLDGSVLNIVK